MCIAWQFMSGVQVAIDAIQAQVFCIHFIIEMGLTSLISQSRGKQILVAFYAGLVKYNVDCIFKLALSFPVKGLMVLEMIGIKIMQSGFNLGAKVPEIAVWRQVAFNTAHPDPACGLVMDASCP